MSVDIQQDLLKFINTELNKNTTGIVFDVFSDIRVTNLGGKNTVTRNGNKIVITKNTIGQLDFDGSYVGLAGVNIANFNMTLQLYTLQDFKNVTANNVINAVEQLKININGKKFDINPDNETLASFVVGVVTAGDTVIADNEGDYVILSVPITSQLGNKLLFGNDVRYYIKEDANFVEIFPLDTAHSLTNATNSLQTKGTNTISGSITDSSWQTRFAISLTNNAPLAERLIKYKEDNNVGKNEIYTLKTTYQFNNKLLSYEKDTIISEISYKTNVNVGLVVNIDLIEATPVLVQAIASIKKG